MQCDGEWSFVDWRFPVPVHSFLSFLSSIPGSSPGRILRNAMKEGRQREPLTRDRFWAFAVKEFGRWLKDLG